VPLDKPDPRFTTSKRARQNFRLALRISLVFIGVLWTIFIIDQAFGLGLTRFGLRPGTVGGLAGIVTAPLLHANFPHILSNTLPLLISATAILYLYPNAALRVVPAVWIGSGSLTWLIGRASVHVGASGLIYGLLVFVFISGILRRDMRSISVSLLVGFLYGSMVWGVLPTRPHMSWEMHLGGALTGGVLAFLLRNWDRVPVLRYDWEDDDRVPDWYPEPRDENDDSEEPKR
jgi:membrane associated rhomboid family serine protease